MVLFFFVSLNMLSNKKMSVFILFLIQFIQRASILRTTKSCNPNSFSGIGRDCVSIDFSFNECVNEQQFIDIDQLTVDVHFLPFILDA